MRMCLVGSEAPTPGKLPPFTLTFDHLYVDRFYRHLSDDPTLCTGCDLACDQCRGKYPSLYPIDFKKDIVAYRRLPGQLPYYVDNPLQYFSALPPFDVLVAIGLHEDVLLVLPRVAKDAGAKLLVVPVEDPDWISKWVRGNLVKVCQSLGIEFVSPKPFCALEAKGNEVIQEFIDYLRIGYPRIKLRIKDNIIVDSQVLVSAPCGCTYYVARNLIGFNLKNQVEKVVAKYWHSYPCVASMKMDPELGDTILHKGGYIHYDIVNGALREVAG